MAGQYTIDQIDEITEKINAKLNIPLIGEKMEAFFVRTLIREIERLIYKKSGKYISEVLEADSPHEITPEEQKAIDELVKDLNKKINIPLIGEGKEKKIIQGVLDFIAGSV